MDNPTRWNITNSAQNIVSALVDPSKQFDHVFRREWTNTFSSFSKPRLSMRTKLDAELKAKFNDYLRKLEDRTHIKNLEAAQEVRAKELETAFKEKQNEIPIPNVFLIEHFDLSNLDTFNSVISSSSNHVKEARNCQLNHANDYEEDDGYLTTNYQSCLLTKDQLKDMQQTFTDYLDIIEEKLASQISNRSGDFFQVMSSVDSVMDELSLAIKSVTNLRRKCSHLRDVMISPNMKNIQLSRTRNNAQSVMDKLIDISQLCKVQPMIQLLLSTSDFNGALDLIAKSRAALTEKGLTKVVCLKHLESQLLEIERVIGAMMHQEFVDNLKYVNKFHEERKKKVESNLDIEQWKMVEDIPQDFQHMISMLIDQQIAISDIISMETDHQQQSNPSSRQHSRGPSDSAIAATDGRSNHSPSSMSINSSSPVKRRLNNVSAAGSTFVVVNSVINLIRILIEYCKCAQEMKSFSAELLERLFNILQLYNSKTYHLVYSAGAIQVAGLKTITTRSLIVSQRSLKLVVEVIPAIQRHFSQLLPNDNRLRRFDEIKLSYEDHAAKIPDLVISIVKDVINLQLREWEAKPPVPSSQFSAVTQHLMRLHENIQDALPLLELKRLFLRITQTFKDVLIMHLRRLNINNETGPQQWLVTQELTFYKISLAKLAVFRGLELSFDNLWMELNSSELDSNNAQEDKEHQQQVVEVSKRANAQQVSASAAATEQHR